MLTRSLACWQAFLAFVKAYIQEFKSKLITSEDFKKFAIAQFKDKIAGFDWDAWFYSEGMPPHVPEFDETVGTFTKSIADAWFYFEPDVALFNVGGKTEVRGGCRPSLLINGTEARMGVRQNAEELWAKWSSVQKQYLLDRLLENTANVENDRPEKALSVAKLNEMDRLYGLTKSKNCELRFRWSAPPSPVATARCAVRVDGHGRWAMRGDVHRSCAVSCLGGVQAAMLWLEVDEHRRRLMEMCCGVAGARFACGVAQTSSSTPSSRYPSPSCLVKSLRSLVDFRVKRCRHCSASDLQSSILSALVGNTDVRPRHGWVPSSSTTSSPRVALRPHTQLRFRPWRSRCNLWRAAAEPGMRVQMLSTQGRMKYTRPLYRDLASFNQGAGKSLALKTFNKNRKFYHPICRKMLAQVRVAHFTSPAHCTFLLWSVSFFFPFLGGGGGSLETF